MWAAAARDPNLAPPAEVASFLQALSDGEFWTAGTYPEFAELRATRWNSFPETARSLMEKRLRRGLPRRLLSSRLTASEANAVSIRRAITELKRIQVAGGVLTPRSVSWLAEQEGQLEAPVEVGSATAGFNPGVRVESMPLPSGAGFDGVRREHLLAGIDAKLKEGDDWDDESSGASRFLGKHLDVALELVGEAAGSPVTLGKLWRAIGHYSRPSDLNGTRAGRLI